MLDKFRNKSEWKMNCSFIFVSLKKWKWRSVKTQSIKFLTYIRFSSFLCVYYPDTIKGFTNKYTRNYE